MIINCIRIIYIATLRIVQDVIQQCDILIKNWRSEESVSKSNCP